MKLHPAFAPLAVLLSATSSFAGSLSPPTITTVAIATPPATTPDWSGFYAGGMVGFDSARGNTLAWIDGDLVSFPMSSNTSIGGFAGYNIQFDRLVVGAEIAISSGGPALEINPDIRYGVFLDLKARAGVNFGKALVYTTAGGSFSNLSIGLGDAPSAGFVYGAGLEVSISENLFVGTEYLIREMTGASAQDPAATTETTLQSIQLRVGWRF